MPDAKKGKDMILVLSVDRDNDMGEKAGMSGPILGRKDVLESAQKLGLADPEDSDMNAVFQAVRMYDDIKDKYTVEVAVLTGHKNVGLQSDKKVSEQLDKVLRKFKADFVILVTDGTEDDHVMPIIQSKVPILSVRRVIVKQSEQLESTYYKIKDFITESSENPKFSRLFFGLPAIALILWALFGFEGWRLIIGVVGAYFFIRGFKLERYITGATEEMQSALTRRRFAFFLYVVSIIFIIFATYAGYMAAEDMIAKNMFEAAAAFVYASIYLYYLAGATAWVGRNVGNKERRLRAVVAVIIFGFAVSLVIYSASGFMINPELPMIDFIFSVIAGFVLLFIALMIEWKT
ncbi:MAG: hypothetical protein DRO99_00730 [Candidatus Aenigmatarchaeota archaeon]|nr:MAG: hypothetical protein DRO99_00730 [Candidatus Aenigmarchaeota archaeon]